MADKQAEPIPPEAPGGLGRQHYTPKRSGMETY